MDNMEEYTKKLLALLYCLNHKTYPLSGALDQDLSEMYAKTMSDYDLSKEDQEFQELSNELRKYFLDKE
ncbi:hypothetical protein [Candidatus Stoquefichus sp. SB1]|uniref:hypothetical protein n=1 Tax=Candidatus Stoquefichus sp. SB1 TaxID=1658109 RepID=UPI00067EC393|nr:hypothetical protein [Candidatus Stoquefichus sp. SB1]